ncbi:MAG: hypothetical protein K2H93_07650 [Oscillospiraceae bacterium]|nr:hypothetical protein [Oscillospiraceae bacterium]
MNKNMLIAGVSLGTVIGSAYFMLSKASEREKHCLKRHTGKAMRAMGDVVDYINSIIR